MKINIPVLVISALTPLAFDASGDVLRSGDELKLTYKNYYWSESAQRGDNGAVWGADRNEWVQAMLVEYNSGFINDWLQFEYGIAAADDLYIGDNINNVTNLEGASAANGYEPDGHLGTQTAYITTRYKSDGLNLRAGAGKKARANFLYRDSTTRIIDATSVGYDLSAEVGALTLFYTELNKQSLRNEDDWGKALTNYNGDRIDAIRYFGSTYRFENGLSLEAGQIEATDYLKERMARARYTVALQNRHALLLGASYGTRDANGELYDRDAAIPFLSFFNEDLDSSFYEVSAGYRLPGVMMSLNYSNVTGGDWNYNLSSSDVRHWDTTHQYAWSWYGLEGEDAVSLLSMVDFGHFGIPGLRWNAGAWFSDDAEGFNDFKRYEFTSMLGYAFSGALDGLSLDWLFSYHRAKGAIDGVERTAYPLGPAGLERKDVNRFYLTYSKTF